MLTTIRKLLKLFEPSEYPSLVGVTLAMVVSGLLQTVGIASIMPFLGAVSNPSAILENRYLSWAYNAFGFRSTQSFLIGLGLFFLIMMVAASSAAAVTRWVIVRVQWRSHRRITARLLQQYLLAPYRFHVGQNSARLAKTLFDDVSRANSKVFLPCARLFGHFTAASLILGLMVWADPRLALVLALVIGSFYATFYWLARKRQQRLGEEVSAAKTKRLKITNEAFGGIKELKVLGREGYALARFNRTAERYSRANAANDLVGLFPRFTLEVITSGATVAAVLYLLQTRASLDQVLPTLAVYALGANRLMPAVQEMFQSLMQIKFGAAAVDCLYADLRGLQGSRFPIARPGSGGEDTPSALHPPAGTGLEHAIRFDQVTFTYPGAPVPAVDKVTLEIPAHTSVGLVGRTGSGKTSLVDLLLGLYEPTGGRILIDGAVLDEGLVPAWRRRVGYVPQAIFLSDESITKNIAFGVPDELVDPEAVRSAAEVANLAQFVATLPAGYSTVVGERGVRLSGGQRQRIGIARALYHRPDVLILDEATSALDNVTEAAVMQAIRDLEGRRTIILIAHRLTTVRDCSLIYVLDRGRIAATGSYDALAASNRTFRALAKVK